MDFIKEYGRVVLVAVVALAVLFVLVGFKSCGWRIDNLKQQVSNQKAEIKKDKIEDRVTDTVISESAAWQALEEETGLKRNKAVRKIDKAAVPKTKIVEGKAVEEPKDERAYRVYDAWRDGIVGVCPDCAPQGS